MKHSIITIVLLLMCSLSIYSQGKWNQPLKIEKCITENGEKLIITSDILTEEKDIYIGLPEHFNDTSEYPLILVLEGEVLFETFAPVTRLAAQLNEIPECIVVGIPFNNKHLDYAPVISGHPESGRADKMLEFYRYELFPLLDSLYHISVDKIIWAHSGLGGIFCTYLLLGPDAQFTGILSSSPNLKWMHEYITKEDAFAELAKKGEVFYYLTFGSSEDEAYMGEMFQQVQELKEKLENEAPNNLVWEYQLNENNNHFTNAIETYMDGLILYFEHMQ